MAGTRLGRYEIGRLLGVGSMGAVYEAVDPEAGKPVAIKVLSAALAVVPAARARFLDEAKLTARVRHPHIVDVTDVGEDAGHTFLVMEKLEGEDLGHRLARSGPLSAAEATDILLPVCEAVAAAHARGVTHRDLKPSNIFLATRDGRPHPVVLDFGIAKDDEASVAKDAGAASGRGLVFGTPYYLAPEQVDDHRAAGPASDQYALGVILYECLTGQRPYVADRLEEVLRLIVAANLVPPSARRPDIPAGLEALVLRAMSSDPQARFPSVAELRQALLPFASKAATDATEPTAPAPEPTAKRRLPSSPAIEVEAATPSPFVRTLTPEIEAMGGPWFAAPEPQEDIFPESTHEITPESPDEISAEMTLPPSSRAVAKDTVPKAEASSRLGPLGFDSGPHRRWRTAVSRKWIGAAAGIGLGVVALAFIATRGSSASAPRAPIVQGEPAPVAPAPAAVNVVAAPRAEEPPSQSAPAPVAAQAPAPAPSETTPPPPREVAPPPPTAVAPPAPTEVAPPPPSEVAPPAPTEVAPPAPSASAPAPSEVAPPARTTAVAPVPIEAAAPKPTAPVDAKPNAPIEVKSPASVASAAKAPTTAVKGPRASDSAPKPPRVRDNAAAVRMHNGVPLLD